MYYVWMFLLVMVNLVWVFLNILGLPGNWLMLLGTSLLAWAYWDRGPFSVWTLLVALVLAVLGEVLEFVAGMSGARRWGGTRSGAWGALLGGLVGGLLGTLLVPIPVIGSLVGACGGAAVGAFVFEFGGGRTQQDALRVGMGAGIGRFLGTVAKLAIGVLMWALLTIAALWP